MAGSSGERRSGARRHQRGGALSRPRSGGGRLHSRRPSRHGGRRTAPNRRLLAGLAMLAIVLLAMVIAGVFSGEASSAGGQVSLIKINGVIDQQMGDYVVRSIGDAENEQVSAIVLQLDTPGGLDTPMRDIIQKMESSPLPIIVYVAPSGARAASAGTFITMASDLAAMAPGTNLGAAHPVAVGATPDTVEGEKILNDAAAYIRGLAQANGHNADWAELAVRQSVSLSADDALSQKVIDMEADSLPNLLDKAQGFHTVAKNLTIETAGASVSEAGMSFREQVLHFITNPNVAFLLLIVGLLAIAYEFVHPGIGIGLITGLICLALALYGLYVLPINFVGVALVVVGVLFLAAELYVPAHGALTVGGIILMVVGSFLLYDSSAPFLRVSLPLSLVMAGIAAAFFVVVARAAVKARRLPKKSPRSAMIGETGAARTALDPLGQVFVRGEIWSAEAPEGVKIEKGEEIEVVDVSGLLLKVKSSSQQFAAHGSESDVPGAEEKSKI